MKKTEVVDPSISLAITRSARYLFQDKGSNQVSFSNDDIHHLMSRLAQVSEENEHLLCQLEQYRDKMMSGSQSSFHHQIAELPEYNPELHNDCFDQPQNDHHPLISPSSSRMTMGASQSLRKLIAEPSVQHFKALSRQVSSQYFQQHRTLALTSNFSQKSLVWRIQSQGEQSETGPTEFSELQLRAGANYESKGCNTEPTSLQIAYDEELKHCWCNQLRTNIEKIKSPLFFLEKMVERKVRGRLRRTLPVQ